MMKNDIANRLEKLREAMRQQNLTAYLIPMADFHGSEYIDDYFKCIEYYSGFTGSAGTLIVTPEEALLWTDGRYFLQAEQQLEGTEIKLQKMGQENVPSVTAFLVEYFSGKIHQMQQPVDGMKEEVRLGFDGRLVSVSFIDLLGKEWDKKQNGAELHLIYEQDLAGKLWEKDAQTPRPQLSCQPVWRLADAYSGRNVQQKLVFLREQMKKQEVSQLLITTLDDICWITNLRGNDIAYNPVFLSYFILSQTQARLYMQSVALSASDKAGNTISGYLKENQITVCDYNGFYQDLKKLSPDDTIWMDLASTNYQIWESVPKECKRVKGSNPAMLEKAVKNPVETENEKKAHSKDGVAVTKFIYWLKTKVRTGIEMATEISAAEKLEDFRKQGEHYIGQSFAPIIAYKEHGAIVHYEAEPETDVSLGNESFLLADTGGHYLEGTTDITRTIVMGELSREQKACYTAVLQGNLRLMDVKFKKGFIGANLDYVAREPLYRMGLDFRHGTGHGVGYLLNVHEGPNAFRLHPEEESVFVEGMITSDEPGVYLDGAYGIRLENLLLCEKREETQYGQFMGFCPLTLVPFDREAILTEMLTQRDKELLDAYHKLVYEKIAPFLSQEEKSWLLEETREI